MKEVYQDLSTAIFADVMQELNVDDFLLPVEIKPNMPDAKIMGRARTVQLCPMASSYAPMDAYRGHFLIDEMEPGEILVVAGGLGQCAYFGELMATLARRQGLAGTIIDGFTRDSAEVMAMKYPVFARGNYAKDIRDHGTVGDRDTPVHLGRVSISSGDLIFGDNDGVVRIPSAMEELILRKAVELQKREAEIKSLIEQQVPVSQIFNTVGEF